MLRSGPRGLIIINFYLAGRPAGLRLRCGDTPAFRTIRRKTEVFNVHTNTQALLALTEQVLNTKSNAKEWFIRSC